MRIADFDLYQELLVKKSGLNLSADKSYMLDSRLTPVAKKWGYPSLDAMTVAMRAVPEPDMVRDIVEAMTVNDTSFFRDALPFDTFRDVIMPYIAKSRGKKHTFRIWSAACSTGQEPYSLAMTVEENKSLLPPGMSVEIIATDLSEHVIDIAEAAEYTQFEAQRGLPIQMLVKYFEQSGDNWRVIQEVRRHVKFGKFNLLDDMEQLGAFDVILCRNVMTYFEEDTRMDVLEKLSRQMAPDGFLFLGKDEKIKGLSTELEPFGHHRGLYVFRNGKYDKKALSGTAAG